MPPDDSIQPTDTAHRASWNSYFTSKAVIAALGGAAAGLSNPAIWWLFLVSIPVAISACFSLTRRNGRVAFVIGYLCLSAFSFGVGYVYFDGHEIASPGWQAMCLAYLAALVFTLVLSAYEKRSVTISR